jgi:hypothetical protein
MVVKIFVAHAHADRIVADALVDLLRKSFAIDDQEICCSSAVGFGTSPKDPIAQAIGGAIDSARRRGVGEPTQQTLDLRRQ